MAFSGSLSVTPPLGKTLWTAGQVWNSLQAFLADHPEMTSVIAVEAAYLMVGTNPPVDQSKLTSVAALTGMLPTEDPGGMGGIEDFSYQGYVTPGRKIRSAFGDINTMLSNPPAPAPGIVSTQQASFSNPQSSRPTLVYDNMLLNTLGINNPLSVTTFSASMGNRDSQLLSDPTYQSLAPLFLSMFGKGTQALSPTANMTALITAWLGDLLGTNPMSETLISPNPLNTYGSPTAAYNAMLNAILGVARGNNGWIQKFVMASNIQFRAQSGPSYQFFNEVYGISDITQIPPKTISYVITDSPPNVQNPTDPAMWSALFTDPFGMNLLNSVATLFPVSAHVPFNWQNSGSVQSYAKNTSDYNLTLYNIYYVWNDFLIDIDEKQSILIRYTFKPASVNFAQFSLVDKDNAFMDILKGVGFLVAFATAVTGIAAALAPSLSSASASGVTLSLPAAETGFTGLSSLSVDPTLMAGASASGVAGATTGATLTSFSGATLAGDINLTPADVVSLSNQGIPLSSIVTATKDTTQIGMKLYNLTSGFEKADLQTAQITGAVGTAVNAPVAQPSFSSSEIASMTPTQQQIYTLAQQQASSAGISPASIGPVIPNMAPYSNVPASPLASLSSEWPILAILGLGIFALLYKKKKEE
jgi:hypothetical protein